MFSYYSIPRFYQEGRQGGKNIPLTTKEISEAALYGICVQQKEDNPQEREKSPLFIPVPLLS